MEPHDIIKLPTDMVDLSVHGRDVRLISRDQVLNWFISSIDALQAGLFLDSSFRAVADMHHRPGAFSCCCHLYGRAPGKCQGGRSLYFAVGTTGGQILIFDDRRVTELVNAYGPDEEVSALAGLASTPSDYHLDHPGELHPSDGRFVSLDASRQQVTLWHFRCAEAGEEAVRQRVLSFCAPVTHLLLLSCQPWLVVAGRSDVSAVSLVDDAREVLHRCSGEEQVGALQYCHGTTVAIAVVGPSSTTVVLRDVTRSTQTCVVDHPLAAGRSLVVAGRHPTQFLLLACRDSVYIHAMGDAVLPFFTIRPRPVNLTGTVHADEVFATHGHNPHDEPALVFRPLHIRFTADETDATRCLDSQSVGQRLCLRTVIGEFDGEVKQLAYSHCMRWLLVVSSSGTLYTVGPNPTPMAPQWNRAPPTLLRPLLAQTLHRHFHPRSHHGTDNLEGDAPPTKRHYRAL